MIKRHAGRWRGRLVTNPWRAFRNQTNVFMGYASRLRTSPRGGQSEADSARRGKVAKYAGISIAVAVLAFLLYESAALVASVSAQTWYGYFQETPRLLEYVGADYLRVSVIALASLLLAVTVGYLLATHHRAGDAAFPVIQIVAAFPAPTYFPLIFIATLPFLEHILPSLYTEVFIFVLGFLSCFYYVFFDFWIGVQAIPSEFVEVTQNYRLPFLTKMRRVILPASLPYMITGLSSTINSAWAGIAIGEYWPNIAPQIAPNGLQVKFGMMYYISSNMSSGAVGAAAYVSLLFAIVVAIYGIAFTRNLMDLARKKYVVEEGIFAA